MEKSIKNNIPLILAVLLLQAVTMTLFKFSALHMTEFSVMAVLTNYLYIITLVFFFGRSIIWQFLISRVNLSTVYPILSLHYINLIFIGHFVFGESVNIYNFIGSAIIIAGVLISTKK